MSKIKLSDVLMIIGFIILLVLIVFGISLYFKKDADRMCKELINQGVRC